MFLKKISLLFIWILCIFLFGCSWEKNLSNTLDTIKDQKQEIFKEEIHDQESHHEENQKIEYSPEEMDFLLNYYMPLKEKFKQLWDYSREWKKAEVVPQWWYKVNNDWWNNDEKKYVFNECSAKIVDVWPKHENIDMVWLYSYIEINRWDEKFNLYPQSIEENKNLCGWEVDCLKVSHIWSIIGFFDDCSKLVINWWWREIWWKRVYDVITWEKLIDSRSTSMFVSWKWKKILVWLDDYQERYQKRITYYSFNWSIVWSIKKDLRWYRQFWDHHPDSIGYFLVTDKDFSVSSNTKDKFWNIVEIWSWWDAFYVRDWSFFHKFQKEKYLDILNDNWKTYVDDTYVYLLKNDRFIVLNYKNWEKIWDIHIEKSTIDSISLSLYDSAITYCIQNLNNHSRWHQSEEMLHISNHKIWSTKDDHLLLSDSSTKKIFLYEWDEICDLEKNTYQWSCIVYCWSEYIENTDLLAVKYCKNVWFIWTKLFDTNSWNLIKYFPGQKIIKYDENTWYLYWSHSFWWWDFSWYIYDTNDEYKLVVSKILSKPLSRIWNEYWYSSCSMQSNVDKKYTYNVVIFDKENFDIIDEISYTCKSEWCAKDLTFALKSINKD